MQRYRACPLYLIAAFFTILQHIVLQTAAPPEHVRLNGGACAALNLAYLVPITLYASVNGQVNYGGIDTGGEAVVETKMHGHILAEGVDILVVSGMDSR